MNWIRSCPMKNVFRVAPPDAGPDPRLEHLVAEGRDGESETRTCQVFGVVPTDRHTGTLAHASQTVSPALSIDRPGEDPGQKNLVAVRDQDLGKALPSGTRETLPLEILHELLVALEPVHVVLERAG